MKVKAKRHETETWIRRTWVVFAEALLALSAAGLGYWFRGQDASAACYLPAGSVPALEYFIPAESFSRIQNTRNELMALCTRYRMEAQSRLVAKVVPGAEARLSSEQELQSGLASAIQDLERGVEDFQGTEQEVHCAAELLLMLKRAGRLDRWIEVYLRTLYEHPTHPEVAAFAKDALAIGQAIGREESVVAALRHLSLIPLDFPGKSRVLAALNDNNRVREVTSEAGAVWATPLAANP